MVIISPGATRSPALTTFPLIEIRPPSHASLPTVLLLIILAFFKNLSILIFYLGISMVSDSLILKNKKPEQCPGFYFITYLLISSLKLLPALKPGAFDAAIWIGSF